MSDYAPVPVGKDEEFGDLLYKFLSVADGSTFNVCASLYEIILEADKEDQAHLFEKAINLYDDIDSNESVQVPVSPYEGQKEFLKEKYGDIVNSFISFFVNQKDSTEIFYKNMWETIRNDVFFPTEAAKLFSFYYVIIDARLPYFELNQGYEMSNEAYRKLRKKYNALLKKVRYILNAKFEQKTERASLLLEELGILMPNGEVSVENVNEYEKKLIAMVEILNVKNRPDIPVEAIIKRLQDRLPD